MRLRNYLFSLLLLLLTAMPSAATAEIAVTPLLIDETLKPRDIVTVPVTINNPDERRYRIYATVNAIDLNEGGEIQTFISPSMDDRSTSITSWIEITRGQLDLPPLGSIEVPLTVKVNPFAKPGEYHAFIGFVPASKRYQAEAEALAGNAKGVVLRVHIPEDRTSLLRLSQFSIDRFITTEPGRVVTYTVSNPGDVPIAPQGELIFYDSKGREVGAMAVNEPGTSVAPGETVEFEQVIPIDSWAGRYKAFLNLQYGDTQVASINDTAFFYLIPIQTLLLVFGVLAVLAITLALLIARALRGDAEAEVGDEVALFYRPGHDHQEHDHDISLK